MRKYFKYEDDDFIWIWRKEESFVQCLKFNKVTDESTGFGCVGTNNNTDPLTGEDFNIKPDAVEISQTEFELHKYKFFNEKHKRIFSE